jgi:hypothetical protein
MPAFKDGIGPGRTDPGAFVAVDTPAAVVKQGSFIGNGFGIVAPLTVHITALKKDAGAYARPVVQRKTLYIRYHALHSCFSAGGPERIIPI